MGRHGLSPPPSPRRSIVPASGLAFLVGAIYCGVSILTPPIWYWAYAISSRRSAWPTTKAISQLLLGKRKYPACDGEGRERLTFDSRSYENNAPSPWPYGLTRAKTPPLPPPLKPPLVEGWPHQQSLLFLRKLFVLGSARSLAQRLSSTSSVYPQDETGSVHVALSYDR